MADEKELERVVHAMVAAVMDEVSEEDFERYDIDPDYHLNDDLFFKYGAEMVRSSRTLTGDALREFLSERDLIP